MAFKAWQTPWWACDGSTFSIAAATLPQPTGDRGEILAEISMEPGRKPEILGASGR